MGPVALKFQEIYFSLYSTNIYGVSALLVLRSCDQLEASNPNITLLPFRCLDNSRDPLKNIQFWKRLFLILTGGKNIMLHHSLITNGSR